MSEITVSIIQRARDFLKVEGDVGGVELHRLLREYRNAVHPDKVRDEEAKKTAEEIFKNVQSLLQELTQFLEQERLSRKPTELAFYSAAYDSVTVQAELDATKAERDELREENKNLDEQLKSLTDAEAKTQAEALKHETEGINELYKPGKASIASLGIVFLLTAVSGIMTKIEEVTNFLRKYSPVDEIVINKILFFLFLAILLITAKRLIEYHAMKQKLNETSSSEFAAHFMGYLTAHKGWDEKCIRTFSERDVVFFIECNISRRRKCLEILGFKLFSIECVETLKKFFIHTLITKRLVEIWTADSLDRNFRIKTGWRHTYFVS